MAVGLNFGIVHFLLTCFFNDWLVDRQVDGIVRSQAVYCSTILLCGWIWAFILMYGDVSTLHYPGMVHRFLPKNLYQQISIAQWLRLGGVEILRNGFYHVL